MSYALATHIVEWMMRQKYCGEDILHAVVCCDHVSHMRFVASLAQQIEKSPVIATKDADLAALRARVKVLEVALRKALRLMTWTDVIVENDKAKYGRLLDEIDAALAPTKEASRG